MAASFEVKADPESLRRISRALESEMDGDQLRRDLSKQLRQAVTPAAGEAKQSILAMHIAGLPHVGESLRASVAGAVKVSSRLTGDRAGVRVSVPAKGPRGFRFAARKLNKPDGWRHPVYGRRGTAWVHQVGKPDWFDKPLRDHIEDYRRAVVQAMEEMGRRIADRIG